MLQDVLEKSEQNFFSYKISGNVKVKRLQEEKVSGVKLMVQSVQNQVHHPIPKSKK